MLNFSSPGNGLPVHIPFSLCISLSQVSVWAPPDKINAVDFALDSAVKTLDYYEEFFDIDYPLPKQGKEYSLL